MLDTISSKNHDNDVIHDTAADKLLLTFLPTVLEYRSTDQLLYHGVSHAYKPSTLMKLDSSSFGRRKQRIHYRWMIEASNAHYSLVLHHGSSQNVPSIGHVY